MSDPSANNSEDVELQAGPARGVMIVQAATIPPANYHASVGALNLTLGAIGLNATVRVTEDNDTLVAAGASTLSPEGLLERLLKEPQQEVAGNEENRRDHLGGMAEHVRPPEKAEYLLWFLPREIRANLIGDLEEEYQIVYARFGRQKAGFWYHGQVASSFGPFVVSSIQRLAGWGVLGWLGDTIKGLIL